jgi:hypothetical protein
MVWRGGRRCRFRAGVWFFIACSPLPRPARLRDHPASAFYSEPSGPCIGPGRGHRATHGQTDTPWARQMEEIPALRPPAWEWFLGGTPGSARRDPATARPRTSWPATATRSPASTCLITLPMWCSAVGLPAPRSSSPRPHGHAGMAKSAQQNAAKAQLSAVHTRLGNGIGRRNRSR